MGKKESAQKANEASAKARARHAKRLLIVRISQPLFDLMSEHSDALGVTNSAYVRSAIFLMLGSKRVQRVGLRENESGDELK